ncbi:MAG: helix-turn-helix domain-containing protein [Eisenbergiella sp.]
MDGTKIVKKLLLDSNINTVELARRLGCGTANIYNKYKRNNFSLNEIEEIADVCGYEVKINFIPKHKWVKVDHDAITSPDIEEVKKLLQGGIGYTVQD